MRLQRGGKPLAGIESRWFERQRLLYYVDKFLSKGDSLLIALLLVKPLFSDVNLGSGGPRRALYPEFAGSWLFLTENNVPVKVAHLGVACPWPLLYLPGLGPGWFPAEGLYFHSPQECPRAHTAPPQVSWSVVRHERGWRCKTFKKIYELYLRPVFPESGSGREILPFCIYKGPSCPHMCQ